MKKLLLLTLVAPLLAFLHGPGQYSLDTKASTVHWVAKKTTGQHEGNISVTSGHLLVQDHVPVGGAFELDMNTITVTDIADPEDNKSLVDHLKNADFFNVPQYPNSTLILKKFERIEKAQPTSPNYYVTGDLTIKGITKSVTFPARLDIGETTVNATADVVIDRTHWNIVYKSKSVLGAAADKFIYDDVMFQVKLVLSQHKH